MGVGPFRAVDVGCRGNTDNLVHSLVVSRSGPEVLPAWVFAAEELLGERLVDNGYRRALAVSTVGDGSPPHHPVSQDLEKIRRHTGPARGCIVLRARLEFPLNPNIVRPNPT